jgi:hypothetical protein
MMARSPLYRVLAAALMIRTNELWQPKPVTVHRTMVNPEYL